MVATNDVLPMHWGS